MKGTRHLFTGHFLLTNLLLETMKSTARESQKEGRIVNLSSEGHRFVREGIRFDKINDESRYQLKHLSLNLFTYCSLLLCFWAFYLSK